MSQRRTAKVAQALRQVVSSAILLELRDPRVKRITVLNVEVPADLRTAKVYVSVMGDERAARLSLAGLESARGWLQQKIADELELRYTPILTFIVDEGVKKSIAASVLLREIQPATDDSSSSEAATTDDDFESDEPDDSEEESG